MALCVAGVLAAASGSVGMMNEKPGSFEFDLCHTTSTSVVSVEAESMAVAQKLSRVTLRERSLEHKLKN